MEVSCSSADVSFEMPKPPSASKAKKVRVNAEKTKSEEVDLPSPSKKIRPNDIDQEIDAHYIGHFHIKVNNLIDRCPRNWLDREIDAEHVLSIEEELIKSTLSSKNQQPWLGIADISVKSASTSKTALKGCRITVIGGRHRHAAYKKASQVSDIHAKELEKVWIDVYDNELSDEKIRRLASQHNTLNTGSMPTNFVTRVHSCREWLYNMSGSEMVDETPPSNQQWKNACQRMYVPRNKDVNTLEPTLQTALLKKEVYVEFRKVVSMFNAGTLKDQKQKKKKSGVKAELTQNQISMPLQGLSDDSKLSLLKEVVSKVSSLKEMKKKSDRIKKKRLVINAFLRHSGETNWKILQDRFPLHATEEKVAQFSDSSITARTTPQEIVSFFERAVEWEKQGCSSSAINIHEERDGVYIFQRGTTNAVLMQGGIGKVEGETISTIINKAGTFKGFSLITASFEEGMTSKDLDHFLMSVHGINVDGLSNYTVAIITPQKEVDMVKQTMLKRCLNQIQQAFWIDTKPQKTTGKMMSNSVHPIVFGHWSKSGVDILCHFEENESCGNAFCFERDEKRTLPKTLLGHLYNHFSFEGHWVLDVTSSKDSGLVAALNSSRNCVSLTEKESLRSTAALCVKSLDSQESNKEQDEEKEEGMEEEKEMEEELE